ncbi:hypothetical protein IFR05_012041 [Cadophora sp. M221]|nr:hypothetical protein IFR05_012041 [Cadophora sp. M221]
MIAPGPTPPITPLLANVKMEVPATPPSTRRSVRAHKNTERGAEFKRSLEKAEKAPKLPITPSRSPRAGTAQESSPKESFQGDFDGKNDQDGIVTPSQDKKYYLVFSPDQVRHVFGRRNSNDTISPSPSPSGEVKPVEPAPALKKDIKAAPKVQRKTVKKPASKAFALPAPMIDSEGAVESQGIIPNIETADDTVKPEPAATVKGYVEKLKKPARAPKRKTVKKSKPVAAPEEANVPKTSANNEAAKEVSNPAPAKKRGYGTAQLVYGETAQHSAKLQKFSHLGRRELVAPEPVVASAEPGPDEKEPTAWLFAYGKEGSEKYLRAKFKGCSFEGYGHAKLDNYKFVLHSDGYAKAVPEQGAEIHGALWKIPEKIRATLEKKAAKHGMKYVLVPDIQPMRKHPDYEPGAWGAPWISHAEPLKCWMGVCEKLDGKEELGKEVARDSFFKRRGLSGLIMEMELAGVPQEYFEKYTRQWVPPPRFGGFDTGYHVDQKLVKPSKKK